MGQFPEPFETSDLSGLPASNPGSGKPWIDPTSHSIIVGALGTFGMTQTTADARYLQLSGGTLTSDLAIRSGTGFGAVLTEKRLRLGGLNEGVEFSQGYDGANALGAALRYDSLNTLKVVGSDGTNDGNLKAGAGTFSGNINLIVSAFTYFSVTTAGALYALDNIDCGSGKSLGWNSRSRMLSPGSGVITLYNNGLSDFSRLQFGGTTSSFPALKRSGTTIQARLADDSADAPLSALNMTLGNGGILTTSQGGLTLHGNGGGDFAYLGSSNVAGGTSYLDPRFVIGSGAYIGFSSAAVWQSVDARIVRSGTAQLDVRAANGLRIRDLAGTGDASLTALNITANNNITMLGYLLQNPGSAANPNLTYLNANNTGPFLVSTTAGSRAYAISTDGAESVRFGGSGTSRATTLAGPFYLAPITFATLPSASAQSGARYRITDRSQRACYSDGTNWRFTADDAIVS